MEKNEEMETFHTSNQVNSYIPETVHQQHYQEVVPCHQRTSYLMKYFSPARHITNVICPTITEYGSHQSRLAEWKEKD